MKLDDEEERSGVDPAVAVKGLAHSQLVTLVSDILKVSIFNFFFYRSLSLFHLISLSLSPAVAVKGLVHSQLVTLVSDILNVRTLSVSLYLCLFVSIAPAVDAPGATRRCSTAAPCPGPSAARGEAAPTQEEYLQGSFLFVLNFHGIPCNLFGYLSDETMKMFELCIFHSIVLKKGFYDVNMQNFVL